MKKNAFLLSWFMYVRVGHAVLGGVLIQASWVPKNNLLFLECSYIERYSYFSYEYLKSTVRDIG